MRLHIILLLLLFLQLTAGALKCDPSHIHGPPGEYEFTDQGKKLKCTGGKEIEITGRIVKYPILYCYETQGWADQNGSLNPVVKADEALFFACKAKDPLSSDKCVEKLIKGVIPKEYTFDNNKVLKCKNNKQIMIEGNPTPFDELKCDETEGWKDGATKIDKEAEKELKIECKAHKCDGSYISGVKFQTNSKDGKYENNKLTCKDTKNAIEYMKKLYPEVTCDETDGWKSGPEKLDTKANAILYVKCAAKACHQSLITGFKDATMTYDSTHKLTCNEVEEAIEYTASGKNKLADSVTCDPLSKWKGQANADTGVLATDAFAVSCVKKACHEDLITVTEKVDRTVPNELKCKQNGMKLKVDNAEYDKLICDNTLGWKDSSGTTAVKQATDRFTVTCNAAAPPTPCAIKQPVPGIIFNSDKKTLTCDPNVPAEITYQGTPYDCEGFIITCDVTSGWTKDTTQFAPANLPLDVSYTKYCATAADVVYKTSSDGGSYSVTCKGPALLEYTENGAAQPVKEMTCSKADGWEKDRSDIQKPSNVVLQELKCNKVCNKHQKPQGSDANGVAQWEDGLTDLAESIEEPGKVRFECNKKLIGDKNNVIELNGKLVNSHLYCDPKGGYKDFNDIKLTDAADLVKIACVDSLCKSSADQNYETCGAIDKTEIPDGYKCLENEYSPFSYTDDPNQLNCKKNSNLNRVFARKLNPPAFLDETLVCKENTHWYKYGDAEQKAISDPITLLCMQLRCNACQQLKGTELKTYSPGTPTKCATHNCTNNLWKIKRVKDQETVEEEYAGEVTCSAKELFDGKWVIDENSASPIAIAEGECITSVETCTKAAKLETACKGEWEGCTTITLNDDTAVTCPVGKMFYMQRGMANLEEGAESIKCDKTKGVWTVTRNGGNDELRRGGTVVCAGTNPAPTTTTTEAPKDPCDICPKEYKTCDKCDPNNKDLKRSENKDSGKCEAFVEFATMSKFETDKGTVEGKLFCGKKTGYIWEDEKGEAVGKFANYKQPPNDKTKEAQTGLIVGGAVGGVFVLVIIAVIIIWTIVITRRRRRAEDDKDDETKKRMLEEGKKRKKQRGDNDEILDEVSVDAPSEIKL
ncbi:hypothetical protein PRIPAC_73281 [Pristionchus pacificus]|uniref:Uncharacterized protein n=1 Tax=Pristionchus pacificus TaxID=54126 RepID=A0A2A6BFS1_PRIPA|nr:hypothetical protein PRIPAC_73281 [Pristionchus pacificus]|eukprot:PDM64651.1 hypothetical protein PRIPAC_52907 [Pristionchus pacificus]